MTSCWSKGSHARYPYYLCPKRGCESYGKSIRRELIEGQFEELLHAIKPTPSVFTVARRMFRNLWDHRLGQADSQAKALKSELTKVEGQVAQFLDRVVEASVPSVIAAYEERIRKLEEKKLLIVKGSITLPVPPAASRMNLERPSTSSQTLGIFGNRIVWKTAEQS